MFSHYKITYFRRGNPDVKFTNNFYPENNGEDSYRQLVLKIRELREKGIIVTTHESCYNEEE